MRWTSSIDIKSFDAVLSSIKSLNEEWYLSKKKYFTEERGYDKSRDKIFVKWGEYLEEYQDEITGLSKEVLMFSGVNEYRLHNYCWNSKFEGCLAYNNVELVADDPLEIHALPFDAKTLFDSIINYYAAFFKGISDTNFIAQEIIANLKAIEEAFTIKNDSSEFDNIKKDILGTIRKEVFSVYGNHVTLFKSHSNKSIERTLTVSVYDKLSEKPLTPESISTKTRLPISSENNIGFEYINHHTNPDSIKDVFTSLLKANLINSHTKLTDFKKVFCNQKVSKRIIWSGTIAELAWFIKMAIEVKKLSKPIKKSHWDICNQCFQLQNHSKLGKDQLRFAKRPASYMHLITIVSNFI